MARCINKKQMSEEDIILQSIMPALVGVLEELINKLKGSISQENRWQILRDKLPFGAVYISAKEGK